MTLHEIAHEIRTQLCLPPGFYVKALDDAGAIMIGNDKLAFAVSGRQIEDGSYMIAIKATWPVLMEALNAHQVA